MASLRYSFSSSCVLLLIPLFSLAAANWKERRQHQPDCGQIPADIVFVLDESTSIYFRDFDRQIEFVMDICDEFDISADLTHIGVITFSNDAMIRFDLTTYTSEEGIYGGLEAISQRHGNTNTHLALRMLRTEMFIPELIRDWVPQIGIVITDGDADDRQATLEEATLLKQMPGVQMMAVGVGSGVHFDSLLDIASSADDVFTADDYESLDNRLKEDLTLQACAVETTTPPPTTTPVPTRPQSMTDCEGHYPLDIMFTLPDHARASDADMAIDFYKDLVDTFNMGSRSNGVRAGLVPRICDFGPPEEEEITLDQHDTNIGFKDDLETKKLPGMDMDLLLEYLNHGAFLPENGGRVESAKYAVILVNDALSDVEAAEVQANAARDAGRYVIAVGVGDNVSNDTLLMLAADPDHVFRAQTYADLEQHVTTMKHLICSTLVQLSYMDNTLPYVQPVKADFQADVFKKVFLRTGQHH